MIGHTLSVVVVKLGSAITVFQAQSTKVELLSSFTFGVALVSVITFSFTIAYTMLSLLVQVV
jgi:hypothetical protein